jgi:hypothetical protein
MWLLLMMLNGSPRSMGSVDSGILVGISKSKILDTERLVDVFVFVKQSSYFCDQEISILG